jgi:hypothetical protein
MKAANADVEPAAVEGQTRRMVRPAIREPAGYGRRRGLHQVAALD